MLFNTYLFSRSHEHKRQWSHKNVMVPPNRMPENEFPFYNFTIRTTISIRKIFKNKLYFN